MKILECYIENFGALHSMRCRLEGGLNSLNEKNGWGKSTFAAYIRAMFYGLEAKRSSARYDRLDYRKNYAPWQGGRFGGYLIFETGGRTYRVTRFFGEKPKEDSFELTDEATGLPSRDFGVKLGDELFGIDAAGFERSAFIPQNSLEAGANDSINAKLLGLLQDENDMNRYEAAMQLLSDQRKELKKTGGRGKIDQDAEKMAKLAEDLKEAEEKDSERSLLKEQLKTAVEEKNSSRSALDGAEEALSHFTEEMVEGKQKSGLSALGIGLLVLGLVFIGCAIYFLINFLGFRQAGIFSAIAGLLFLVLGIVTLIRGKEKQQALSEELERLQESVRNSRLTFETAQLKEDNLNRRIDDLSKTADRAASINGEIDVLREGTESDKARLYILEEAMEKLKEARQNLSRHYLDTMRLHFRSYLDTLGLFGDETELDLHFNISVEEHGERHPLQAMSCGTRDLLNLAARFALVDAMYEEERPCLILDDVMNNLDDVRFRDAMHLVQRLSERYQIIYLTCNSARMP